MATHNDNVSPRERMPDPDGKQEVQSGRQRRYDPIETRARILEAAYELFSTQGYDRSSTADIARVANVSEGSIFYHFSSKPALLAELGNLHGERIVAAFETGISASSPDFLAGLESFFDYIDGLPFMPEPATDKDRPDGRLQARPRDTYPFFDAARAVVANWLRPRIVDFAAPGTISDPHIATSLLTSLLDDAVRQFRAPGTSREMRRKVRMECIRFTRALLSAPGP